MQQYCTQCTVDESRADANAKLTGALVAVARAAVREHVAAGRSAEQRRVARRPTRPERRHVLRVRAAEAQVHVELRAAAARRRALVRVEVLQMACARITLRCVALRSPLPTRLALLYGVPQAVLVLHAIDLSAEPLQLAPPYAGAGSVHVRV